MRQRRMPCISGYNYVASTLCAWLYAAGVTGRSGHNGWRREGGSTYTDARQWSCWIGIGVKRVGRSWYGNRWTGFTDGLVAGLAS